MPPVIFSVRRRQYRAILSAISFARGLRKSLKNIVGPVRVDWNRLGHKARSRRFPCELIRRGEHEQLDKSRVRVDFPSYAPPIFRASLFCRLSARINNIWHYSSVRGRLANVSPVRPTDVSFFLFIVEKPKQKRKNLTSTASVDTCPGREMSLCFCIEETRERSLWTSRSFRINYLRWIARGPSASVKIGSELLHFSA